jgi:hypothetical protein
MDRFDIVLGHYVFCALHHTGQGSALYERLSRITGYFQPGSLFREARLGVGGCGELGEWVWVCWK